MSEKLGFILLAHTALDRVAQVARFVAQGGNPVVIHVDARTPAKAFQGLQQALTDLPDVRFSKRHRCDWGTWSLVAAMQTAAEQMLAQFPGVERVYAMSGACLPLRPVSELEAWLARHPDTDFIESVNVGDVNWTKGGLSKERFTLWFPIGFKRNKWLFDRLVDGQRLLRMKRDIPDGIVPHIGSQWWCLTRETLNAILTDPMRGPYDRYFKRVWIPDESYFQTLVRLHARRIESRTLTLGKFDHQGKPHVFYDDHLQLLRRSDCFMARKIWAGSDRLYQHFLAARDAAPSDAEPQPSRIDRHFARATEQRVRGRAGLYMASRFPVRNRENGKTAEPYSVFQGFTEVFQDFEGWLAAVAQCRVHGHLFAPRKVQFAGRERVFTGGLSDSATLRDYNPRAFLTNLLWATRGERQCFQFGPGDTQGKDFDLLRFMATDSNAQISVISGAWAVPLYRSGGDFAQLRREAARLQRIETAMLDVLQSPQTRARIRIWTMAEFLENPAEPLHMLFDEIAPHAQARLIRIPDMVDLGGFGSFLQELRNQGMQPVLMGDFPQTPVSPDPSHRMK
ncbi:beta-1,6-N-acetylglucosaminyltransferase [Pararhodobacter zhoushanensis]|uniref:Peptide O-xylosyltransferase n=1 Tax=Pararhodobacter zhoushanensis TaxID=2479545 RepID=A0ABT3GUT6_9RHOB|nr:beta-1,6-N-acetylglucosaminyltransferase [Pararhodobacter zhoushanensis]MCW1931289.1 beta-1,6-N-acetylglucosaminyltransferase [Pararhodobacter zhoushanensis]